MISNSTEVDHSWAFAVMDIELQVKPYVCWHYVYFGTSVGFGKQQIFGIGGGGQEFT